MDPLISVIIPVYKVEEYIHECVDSVLRQTYRNIEVILVDDGSPDYCPHICDEYAEKDSRVKVVHKLNGGLSDARNVGLDHAIGDYVVFLDSDDYWSVENALESLVQIVVEYKYVDIIYFRRFAFIENNGQKVYEYPLFDESMVNGKTKEEALKYLITHDRFVPSACNKLVNKNILDNIKFTKGLLSEDIDWNFAITLKARNLFVCNELFYAYRRRKGSITSQITERTVDNLLCIIEKWSKLIPTSCADKNTVSLLLGYCAYQLSIILGLTYLVKGTSRFKEFIIRIDKLNNLWEYSITRKTVRVKKLYNMFGCQWTGRILAQYIRMKA